MYAELSNVTARPDLEQISLAFHKYECQSVLWCNDVHRVLQYFVRSSIVLVR